MHTITAARLQAAQAVLSATQSRVWGFVHPETDCLCRAEYDAGLLRTEVTAGPPNLDIRRWWDADASDDAICETMNDLAKHGLLRTAVASPEAALRELRLVVDASAIWEIV